MGHDDRDLFSIGPVQSLIGIPEPLSNGVKRGLLIGRQFLSSRLAVETPERPSILSLFGRVGYCPTRSRSFVGGSSTGRFWSWHAHDMLLLLSDRIQIVLELAYEDILQDLFQLRTLFFCRPDVD